jgi:hypothetical protein
MSLFEPIFAVIQLKRLANRPEDQRDIEALQAIRRSKRHD